MASLNRVLILGNLGRDPELRYTQNQTAVVTLNVATTDFRLVEGQRQDQTEWHRVVVWGKQAENCNKYLKKGRSVLVEGRLQTRSYDDKSGVKRYSTEIVAQNVKFIGGSGGQRADGPTSADYDQPAEHAGSGGGSEYNPSDQGYGAPETPGMDEIPF